MTPVQAEHRSWCAHPESREPFCMAETLRGDTRATPSGIDTGELQVTMSQTPTEAQPEIVVTRDDAWCLSLTPSEAAVLVAYLTKLIAAAAYR